MTYNNTEYHKKRRENSQYDTHHFTAYLLSQVKSSAKKRGIPFKLTYDILYSKLVESNGKCALSGLQMNTLYNSPMKVSIDRIDSSKGYTKNNIQCVAGIVNKSKNELSDAEYVELCRAVVGNAKRAGTAICSGE